MRVTGPGMGTSSGGVDVEAGAPHPPLRGTFSRGEKVKTLRLVGDAMGNRDSPRFAILSL